MSNYTQALSAFTVEECISLHLELKCHGLPSCYSYSYITENTTGNKCHTAKPITLAALNFGASVYRVILAPLILAFLLGEQ